MNHYSNYNNSLPPQHFFNNSYTRGKNEVPWGFIYIYLGLSLALCYLYHIKIVSGVDWNAPNSINAVASFETAKPYQFRLLMPLLFKFFGPIYTLYGKYLYSAYNVVIVLFVQMVFYKLLCVYFQDKKRLLWLAPVILYPMLFNYVILNQSFQYYDFTAILFFTIGLYYIANEKFIPLLIIFLLAIINKETAGYLIFTYLLYNYKGVFSKKVVINTFMLGIIFIGWKILLGYIFKDNPGDNFEIGFSENIRIAKELFSNRVLLKNFFLNFGGLYIFAILLFVTGAWKKFPQRALLFMNLTIVPYYIFGIYITYITEVRVYTELIPMITTLFLIYLSRFEKIGLKPYPRQAKKEEFINN